MWASQISQDDNQEQDIVDGNGGDNLPAPPSYDKIEKYNSNQPSTPTKKDQEEESASLSQPTIKRIWLITPPPYPQRQIYYHLKNPC